LTATLQEGPCLGLLNVRAAIQAFQLKQSFNRVKTLVIWLVGDWLLADALTKKSQESRRSLLQILSSVIWMPKYSPDFTVSAKKPKSKGLDAVSQIQSITGKRAEKNFAPMQQN